MVLVIEVPALGYLSTQWSMTGIELSRDRRPASNADPYKIIAHIVGTLTK